MDFENLCRECAYLFHTERMSGELNTHCHKCGSKEDVYGYNVYGRRSVDTKLDDSSSMKIQFDESQNETNEIENSEIRKNNKKLIRILILVHVILFVAVWFVITYS